MKMSNATTYKLRVPGGYVLAVHADKAVRGQQVCSDLLEFTRRHHLS